MAYSYTVSRFDPNDGELRPLQTRVISAESEDNAIDSLADPGDGTYWEVIDTNDPAVIRLNGGNQ